MKIIVFFLLFLICLSNEVFYYQSSDTEWKFAEINRCVDLVTSSSFFEKISDVQVEETNYKSRDCSGDPSEKQIATVQFEEPVTKYRIDYFSDNECLDSLYNGEAGDYWNLNVSPDTLLDKCAMYDSQGVYGKLKCGKNHTYVDGDCELANGGYIGKIIFFFLLISLLI